MTDPLLWGRELQVVCDVLRAKDGIIVGDDHSSSTVGGAAADNIPIQVCDGLIMLNEAHGWGVRVGLRLLQPLMNTIKSLIVDIITRTRNVLKFKTPDLISLFLFYFHVYLSSFFSSPPQHVPLYTACADFTYAARWPVAR